MTDHHEHDHENDHEDDHHDGHADHAAQFRDRFWLSLVLALPVVVYSEQLQSWLGYSAPGFPGAFLVQPVLGTLIFVYGGWPFLAGAAHEARGRQPGMMLLIGMAITVAFGASAVASLGWFEVEVWWELALLIVVMLLGHWLEMRAVGQASGALDALAEMLPADAERVTGDGTETVPIDGLDVGDVVLVRPGGRVPADGDIVDGSAELDESMITGESRPVSRAVGDRVVAGTVATDSSLRIEITAVGDDTALAGIHRLVAEAQESRSRSQQLADRAAALLFYVAVGAAALTVAAWSLAGDTDAALVRSVTVLIIACPHALGLAIPLVTSISTSLAARAGILVTDRLALERMRSVDTVLFDKTGTLTRGNHRVTDVAVADDDVAGLLRRAASVEVESEHPLARAIVAAAEEHGDVPHADDIGSLTGRGVRGRLDGVETAVGGPALIDDLDVAIPDVLTASIDEWAGRGAAVVHVVEDGAVTGALALEDEIRPESVEAVRRLHEHGVDVVLITGDAQQVADAVARDLGIDEVFAEVLPEDKDRRVADLQGRDRVVAMVGDGVNDAPALARADVGIAIGAGTDVAVESAGVVLASDDPRAVVAVRRLSEATYRKMRQNLVWAAGYNVFAIPLAAGVLAWAGIVLPMAVGALLMSASTVIVALNAQLLRRIDLGADRDDDPVPERR